MAEVVLFHHALGRTAGVTAFAERLREAGHVVHTPDLFHGKTFATIDEGVGYVETVGMERFTDQGIAATNQLPDDLVYAGFSLGVLPAQKLAQSRAGARGALLFSACVPAEFFGPWPTGVPVQVHAMDRDPIFNSEGDLEAAQALTDAADNAELFLYPGDQHLFADTTLSTFDPEATELLVERVLAFLARA